MLTFMDGLHKAEDYQDGVCCIMRAGDSVSLPSVDGTFKQLRPGIYTVARIERSYLPADGEMDADFEIRYILERLEDK